MRYDIFRRSEVVANLLKKRVIIYCSHLYGIDSVKTIGFLDLFTHYKYTVDELLHYANQFEIYAAKKGKALPEGTFYEDIFKLVAKKYYISDRNYNG